MEHKLDGMCLNCQHLKTVCDGSYSGFYSGCVLKGVDHDRAAAYIDAMTQAIYKDIDTEGARGNDHC